MTNDLGPVTSHDLWYLFIGKLIGKGQNRDVYEYLPAPNGFVIKHETRGDLFQNIMEYRVWEEVQGTSNEKWFAPCVSISPNGRFLIQGKVHYPEHHKYPKKLPIFFTDTKYQNYGLYKGKWVASDYGYPRILKDNQMKKLRPVKWWSE